MSAVFDRIDRLQKELEALLPMKQEDAQRLEKKIRLEFNYNSNHIEGNTLTYGETELLLIYGETNGHHDKREFDEIEGHDIAFDLIQQWAKEKDKTLTEADIRNLNQVILVKPFWKDALTPDGQETRRLIKVGQYKEHPNSVRLQNGEIFNYASPAETPIKMGELMEWFREEEEKKELHPVALAGLFHYKFVCIHPFDDGNGRISRLLMNYVLLKNDLPPVIIKSSAKKDYLNALHLADTGNLEAFINYVGEQLLWSFDVYLKATVGESIDEPGDLDKKLRVLKGKLNTPVNEVRIEKDVYAIIDCCENSISPLLETIISTLNKFDAFFNSRDESAYLYISEKKIEEYDTLSEAIFSISSDSFNYDNPRFNYNGKYKNMRHAKYLYKLSGFRNIKNNIKLEVGVDIFFYQFVYEVKFPVGVGIGYNKPYYETFSYEECKSIADAIGNDLFNQMELFLKP